MVKAVVRNLRRVQTAVWIGGKRYVFPARIKVRMNLTEEMVEELRRNHAFEVQIVGVVDVPEDVQTSVQTEEEVKAEIPQEDATEPYTEDVSSPVEVEDDETQVEGTPEEPVQEDRKPDFFSMKKDDLCSYLKEHGVDAEGMSRKEMLRKVKEV